MPVAPSNSNRVAFDCYQADLATGQLFKRGNRIRLQPQPFKILEMMLARPGELVTREEICRALWNSDTFVDFDHSLGTAINKIREALNDSAELPKFIETIPKRGYRFIGEVQRETNAGIANRGNGDYGTPNENGSLVVMAPPLVPPPGAASTGTASLPYPPWLATGPFLVSAAVIILGVFLGYRYLHPEQQSLPVDTTVVPFTAMPGQQVAPAFSPDGSRIAFGWRKPESSGFDLYVKGVGSETLLRLTNHPSEWISPAWSPDGTQIAFHRLGDADTGVYVVPALGGPERKLRATHVPYSVAAPISWSPDGKWIGFGDVDPIQTGDRNYLLSLETLQVVQIPHNPRCLNEAMPTFSHRGDRLAFVCVLGLPKLELYTIDLKDSQPNGKPKLIAPFENVAPGLAWSADDRSIVVSRGTADSLLELDEFATEGGSRRVLDFAPNGAWPAISPNGETLAYTTESDRANIWRADLRDPGSPPAELVPSTRLQQNPVYSPDGKYMAFNSNRSGTREIWMSDANGSDLVQMTRLHGDAWAPRFSPDGNSLVFAAHVADRYEIYTEDIFEQVPRKLATNMKEVFLPNWSRDGKWIYFIARVSPRNRIYRCPASGGDAVPVTSGNDDTGPWESEDESTLYFVSRPYNASLRRLWLKGPPVESAVEGLPHLRSETLWAVTARGIYYVPANSPRMVYFLDFASKTSRKIFESPGEFSEGLSVSPDGRWLLYSQVEDINSSIMLAEHFR